MVKLIDWMIAAVGLSLPLLGFGLGCFLSTLCLREPKDIIAIAVETGIQDTGMAIFVLWFKMDHPAGDPAAVSTEAVASLTPVHLLAALGYYSLRTKLCTGQIKQKKEENTFKDNDAEALYRPSDTPEGPREPIGAQH